MKRFLSYLYTHTKVIIAFCVIVVIFLLVFWLYMLPLAAVGYAALVSTIFGSIFLIADYISYNKRLNMLEALTNTIDYTITEFPNPYGSVEEEYQRIIALLDRARKKMEYEMNVRYQDIIDYYTIWAHQIKTPIAAMYLLLQNNDVDNNRELVCELQRIEQYVDMVLCYLRLDSTTTDYVIRQHELDDIVKQAVRKFASQFIRKKIRLIYEPLNVRVYTDEKWMLFVIEQILSNSLKYTKKGSIEITVESGNILCIRDTGIGIDSSDIPRVFEKGFTGYQGRNDKKATGIGLYLVKRILRKLGDEISIDSKIDEGTIVRILLNVK